MQIGIDAAAEDADHLIGDESTGGESEVLFQSYGPDQSQFEKTSSRLPEFAKA